MQDLSNPAAVEVTEVMQNQTFIRVPPNSQRPLLPRDQVVFNGEARTLWLRDGDWLQVSPQWPNIIGAVACRSLRDWDGINSVKLSVIDDFDYFSGAKINVDQQSLYGTRVAVVIGSKSNKADAARDSSTFLGCKPKGTSRPGINLHMLQVDDPAARHRCDVIRVFLAGQHGDERLAHQQRGAHALNELAFQHPLLRNRDEQLDHREFSTREYQHFDCSQDRVTLAPSGQRFL